LCEDFKKNPMAITGTIFTVKKINFTMQQNQKNPPKDQLSDQIDSPHDRKELEELDEQPDSINIPDAHEIPGQEDFTPAPLGEVADTTASSADEEGDDFDENLDEEIINSPDSNVSDDEKETLARTFDDMPGDDENLREAALDNTDDDGTPLNEESFTDNISASDLDIPGEELDDPNEDIGEEDEENNDYSLGGDNDTIPRDQF
jgi:hypothetical protein